MAPHLSLLFLSISLLLFASARITADKNGVNSAIKRINDTVSETVKLAKFLQTLQKKYESGYESSALKDCHELLMDSKSLMKDSIKALKKYRKDRADSHVGDAQTWLSAALTDVDTCYDGLKDSSNKALKDDIGSKIDDVEKLMDVNLEIVNELRV